MGAWTGEAPAVPAVMPAATRAAAAKAVPAIRVLRDMWGVTRAPSTLPSGGGAKRCGCDVRSGRLPFERVHVRRVFEYWLKIVRREVIAVRITELGATPEDPGATPNIVVQLASCDVR
ncbi:hypothetical protein Scani_07780 [Streptomyces caniferus]|uniref:Uncharacterized protein n=1 Tax=Streptomyces caniferus TaxID=285557 RepID=A0A640S051_9ACTN|nr:hypothetical protein Scani_07780 [Streptomyces caniferus]